MTNGIDRNSGHLSRVHNTEVKPLQDVRSSEVEGETRSTDADTSTMTEGQVRMDGAVPTSTARTGAAVAVRNTVLTEKDKGELRPGVAELYGTYGIKARLGRPKERLLTWTAVLQDKLTAAGDTPKAVAKSAVQNDFRRQVFLLEGLLKLYDGPHPELKLSFAKVKLFEDTLGAVSAALDLKETAELVTQAGNTLPSGAAHYIEELQSATQAALERVVSGKLDDAQKKELMENAGITDEGELGQLGLMPDDSGKIAVFDEMIGSLENAKFRSYKKDRAWLKDEIRGRLDDIDDTDYDMSDLQGQDGLHDFRRDLRWLPIFAEALDGLFVLDKGHNPVKEYEKLLITDAADPDFVSDLSTSKFVRLPDAELEDKPIKMSLSLYTANMKGVLDFGKLKDRGEAIENIAHALVHGGNARDTDEALPIAMDLLGKPRDTFDSIVQEANGLYKQIRLHDLIDELEDELK